MMNVENLRDLLTKASAEKGFYSAEMTLREELNKHAEELIASAERVARLEAALQKIEQRAYNEEPAEELEDCQRDLRHIHSIARQALGGAK